MDARAALPGLRLLQEDTLGDPDVCIAVLDGPVDLSHPCFDGANIRQLPTLVPQDAGHGVMSAHGTHVASVLFGRPGSSVHGIAPDCRGLIVPIFRDSGSGSASQLDLARAIEQAVQAGATVVSVSGGERVPAGEPDALLARALALCEESGVLVVAAVGNDASECLQVPAAVTSVLAVGAIDALGVPLATSNWHEAYWSHGVVAPGQDIDGAAVDGGTVSLTGSSFATPLVSGVAALLLALGRRLGQADARDVRRVVVATADPGDPGSAHRARLLAGALDVAAAHRTITEGGKKAVSSTTSPAGQLDVGSQDATAADDTTRGGGVAAAGCACATAPIASADEVVDGGGPAPVAPVVPARSRGAGVVAAGECGCGGAPGSTQSFVYAIGTIGYDFGTEARRDSFRQQMPATGISRPNPDGSPPEVFYTGPPNPYDPRQMSDYLRAEPWVSSKLIWTMNLERTPIYALESEVPFGMQWGQPTLDEFGSTIGANLRFPPVAPVYKTFHDAIAGQALAVDDPGFISRVSIPGTLTGRTVRLYSGQIVPVVVVSSRGVHTWNEPALVGAAVDAVKGDADRRGLRSAAMDDDTLAQNVRAFLDKIYFQFRNLGQSPGDRALNFAATNAFLVTNEIREGLLSASYVPGPNTTDLYSLDTISVAKSPFCRMDSDCWDVQITFFSPENERRARVTYLFTIDVSDELPVSLAPAHRFLVGTP